MKSSKSQKVKTIVRNSCLQQKSPLRASQPTMRSVRTLTRNQITTEQALSAVKQMNLTVMPLTLSGGGQKVESGDLILVFINSDEEDANDRPNATRSG